MTWRNRWPPIAIIWGLLPEFPIRWTREFLEGGVACAAQCLSDVPKMMSSLIRLTRLQKGRCIRQFGFERPADHNQDRPFRLKFPNSVRKIRNTRGHPTLVGARRSGHGD